MVNSCGPFDPGKKSSKHQTNTWNESVKPTGDECLTEAAGCVHLTIQLRKTVHRDPGRPRHKLEEADSLLCVHQQDGLQETTHTCERQASRSSAQPISSRPGKLSYFPKPLDNDMVGAVAVLVLGVFSPVVHVHISQTAHEQLKDEKRTVVYVRDAGATERAGEGAHLQLVLIEDLDQILWDQLEESLKHTACCCLHCDRWIVLDVLMLLPP